MRLLFAYDHRFRSADDGRVWTTGAMSSSVWARYLNVFDRLHVVARSDGAWDGSGRYARSDAEGVHFTLLDSVNSPAGMLRIRAAQDRIHDLVAHSDAVVARLPSEFGLIACAAARRLNKPYLVEVVGSAYDAYINHGSWLGKCYAPIAERRVRRAVRQAPFAIYVTEAWLQSQYPSMHPEIVGARPVAARGLQAGATDALLNLPVPEQVAASVTNAAVVLPVSEVHANRAKRLESVAGGQEPVLGTIGSLATRYKGIQVALPALAELRREGFRFTYRILGGGDPAPWQKLIDDHGLSDCCFLDGVLPAGPRVLEWLDEIDIYLQPSLTEALPRAILEAMSRGLACVGSSVGGIPELIVPGYVHRASDARQLAGHLRKLMSDPAEVARLSEASFQRVLNYAPAIVEGKREAMLRALRRRAEHPLGAVLVDDHIFRRGAAGEVWAGRAQSRPMWDGYLRHFEHLTVVGRDGGSVGDLAGCGRADLEGVDFELMPDINGIAQAIRRPRVRRRLAEILRSADAVIVRLPSELGFMACALAQELHKPLLVEVAGSAGDALRARGSPVARAYAFVADRRVRHAVARSRWVIPKKDASDLEAFDAQRGRVLGDFAKSVLGD